MLEENLLKIVLFGFKKIGKTKLPKITITMNFSHSFLRNISNITLEEIHKPLQPYQREVVVESLCIVIVFFMVFFILRTYSQRKQFYTPTLLPLKQSFRGNAKDGTVFQEEVVMHFNEEYKDMPYKRKSINSPLVISRSVESFPINV